MLRIKLVKSVIGEHKKNRLTVVALGLRKTQQVVEHRDTPSVRGMVHKVKHLLQVEEVADAAVDETKPAKAPKKAKAETEAPAEEAKPAKPPRAKKAKTEDASAEAEPVAAGEKE